MVCGAGQRAGTFGPHELGSGLANPNPNPYINPNPNPNLNPKPDLWAARVAQRAAVQELEAVAVARVEVASGQEDRVGEVEEVARVDHGGVRIVDECERAVLAQQHVLEVPISRGEQEVEERGAYLGLGSG